jgi:hypothetical protein
MEVQVWAAISNGIFWGMLFTGTVASLLAKRLDEPHTAGLGGAVIIGTILHFLPLHLGTVPASEAYRPQIIAFLATSLLIVVIALAIPAMALPARSRGAGPWLKVAAMVVVCGAFAFPLSNGYSSAAVGLKKFGLEAEQEHKELVAKEAEERKAQETVYSETAARTLAQLAIKDLLKDPGSAQFRNLGVNTLKNGVKVVCGEVNARNGFGGYSGFEGFISAGTPKTTFLQSRDSKFSDHWKKLCA